MIKMVYVLKSEDHSNILGIYEDWRTAVRDVVVLARTMWQVIIPENVVMTACEKRLEASARLGDETDYLPWLWVDTEYSTPYCIQQVPMW